MLHVFQGEIDSEGNQTQCVAIRVAPGDVVCQWRCHSREGPPESGRETGSTTSVDAGEDCNARICLSVAYDLAIAAKSMVGGAPEIKALVSIRESVSVTTLSNP